MSQEITFPCTGCGLCCKQVGKAVAVARILILSGSENPYVKDIADFPFGVTESGTCEKLNADNTCSVYNDRPMVCQIDKVWEKHYKHNGVPTKNEYFISTAMLCNSMMVEANIDEKFFIDIEKTQLLWKTTTQNHSK